MTYLIKALGWLNIGVGLLLVSLVLGYVRVTAGHESMVTLITIPNVLASLAAISPGIAAISVGMWIDRRGG
jgi:hypothetical protein